MSLPTLPSPSAPTACYNASCHCGAFTYTVTASPPLSAADAVIKQCNCSICARNAYMFIFVPNEQVVFEKGGLDEFKVCFYPIPTYPSFYTSIFFSWEKKKKKKREPEERRGLLRGEKALMVGYSVIHLLRIK